MEFKQNAQKEKYHFILYAILFISAWTVHEIVVARYFDTKIIYHVILWQINKFFVWILPVYFYVRFIEKKSIIDYFKFKFSKEVIKIFLLIMTLVTMYIYVGAYLTRGIVFRYMFSFHEWIAVILCVGFIEETVFRGFILKKVSSMTRFYKANIITSLLFLLVHFGIWIKNGIMIFPNIIGTMIFVFFFGFLMGVLYKRSESIWFCFFAHSLTNFIVLSVGM